MHQRVIHAISSWVRALRENPPTAQLTPGSKVALALGVALLGVAITHPDNASGTEVSFLCAAVALLMLWSQRRAQSASFSTSLCPPHPANGERESLLVRPLVAVRSGDNATSLFSTLLEITRLFPGQRMLILDNQQSAHVTRQALRGIHVLARQTPVWVVPEALHAKKPGPLPLSLRLTLQGRFSHLVVVDADAPEALTSLPWILRRLRMESPTVLMGQGRPALRANTTPSCAKDWWRDSLRAPALQCYTVDALRSIGDLSLSRSLTWRLRFQALRAGIPFLCVTVPGKRPPRILPEATQGTPLLPLKIRTPFKAG